MSRLVYFDYTFSRSIFNYGNNKKKYKKAINF